jgi:hypothetical protein
MRVILLAATALLFAGCMSAPRTREAHCLSTMMMDAWQAKNDLASAEDAWHAAQRARFERRPADQESLILSNWMTNGYRWPILAPVSVHKDDADHRLPESDEERELYRRFVSAHARYGESARWYGRVARRVQSRFEEDEMLYPILKMLVTSPAIVLYPVVRWNVRSAIWDEEDPDAENDPVQVFCAARLGEPSHADR